jgi:parvulin-like peptidyl-prolyl isomerase
MTQGNLNDVAKAGCQSSRGRKRGKILLAGLLVMALCGAIRYYWNAPPASADPSGWTNPATNRSANHSSRRSSEDSRDAAPQERQGRQAETSDEPSPAKAEGAREPAIPAIVATVNTQRISREDLAKECMRHFGKETLESMVNKRLITRECRRQGITVTREEVDSEIEQMAKRFRIPVDQWKKLLKQERNISPEQYASDIIWPTIALRKLAGGQLQVTREELRQEYETQYGEQVKVRLIAVGSLEKAKRLRAQAAANPDEFGNLAKKYSEDATSAAAKGIINPIRRHGSYEEIEETVFSMGDGDISPVIKVNHAGGQYVILKREGLVDAQPVSFEDAKSRLEGFIRDKKTRGVAQDVFQTLQDRAAKQKAIQIVWSDPAKRQRMPGVAALIYDDEISLRQLADECMVRHGQEVLEGLISHKIVVLECRRRNIAITEKDLDREIAEAAAMGIKSKPDGSPDVEAWLALIKKRGIPLDVYRNDLIWTSVAMKKLVGSKIAITDDDLKKGFDANYGERVRCKAVVLNDMRRANQVFEMARKNNTSEFFAKLATQYSVEPGSQALEGDVPPIKRFGGQPDLEKEAFQLQAGELSGIIQVGDKFVILRCEGRTKPVAVRFADVRDEIYTDLHQKKLRLAMQEQFESLQDAAIVDNYLANTSHSPRPTKTPSMGRLPALKQIPSR